MAQKPGQKDNSTLRLKAELRRSLLSQVEQPFILETHGGFGHIWRQVYSGVPAGVVFETDPDKAAALAQQRPTWAVYEADCVTAIAAGAVDDWPVNFVDLDPYGEPWPVLDAFFGRTDRDWPTTLAVVVNDGLRRNTRFALSWSVPTMAGVVAKYGNQNIFHNYLAICRELLETKAGQVGYTLARWVGYYCGHAQDMTHYAAILTR